MGVDKLFTDALVELHANGHLVDSRDGFTREIMGFHASMDPRKCLLRNERRKIKLSYAAAELIWYLSGECHIDRVAHYAPQYARFADAEGIANGAYGPRLLLLDALAVLRRDLETRQCVVPIFRPGDLGRTTKDIPCTIALHFMVRDMKLNLFVSMRSNDVWLGLPYDIFAFCMIQHLVAARLGLELGRYHHAASSLHLYDRNAEAAKSALTAPAIEPAFRVNLSDCNWNDIILMEEQIRKNPHEFEDENPRFAPYSMGATLCSMLIGGPASRWKGYSFLGDQA